MANTLKRINVRSFPTVNHFVENCNDKTPVWIVQLPSGGESFVAFIGEKLGVVSWSGHMAALAHSKLSQLAWRTQKSGRKYPGRKQIRAKVPA